jgi:hypothetical protein
VQGGYSLQLRWGDSFRALHASASLRLIKKLTKETRYYRQEKIIAEGPGGGRASQLHIFGYCGNRFGESENQITSDILKTGFMWQRNWWNI